MITNRNSRKKKAPHAATVEEVVGALPPEAFDRLPVATLTLTKSAIYLTRHDDRGEPLATYPVQAGDVASVFNNYGADSGLLPENLLFWQAKAQQMRVGIWLPPARRALRLATGRTSIQITVPLPGLIFVGCGPEYSIYAAPARPTRPDDDLFHAPLPNVYDDGRICTGSVRMPICDTTTICQAATLFFESEFNDHLIGGKLKSGQNLMSFLRSLDHKRNYPAKQLAPNRLTMMSVLNGTTRWASAYTPPRVARTQLPTDDHERVIDPFYGPIDGIFDGDDDDALGGEA